jgi:hypothetical protein
MSTPEEMEIFYANVFQVDDDDLVITLFQQGLNTTKNFNQLTIEDITRVCNNIKRPGGMVQDEDGNMVANRGQQGSAVLEKRFKQLWLFV